MSINVYQDDIFSAAEPFVTKLGMVKHCIGPECHVKRLVCYFQGQGHIKAHIIKNDCFYHIH